MQRGNKSTNIRTHVEIRLGNNSENFPFFPRCMECQRGLSVRPSVKRMHCGKTEERSDYTQDHLA